MVTTDETVYNLVDFETHLAEFSNKDTWGVDQSLFVNGKNDQTWARQAGFLASYSEMGTILRAAPIAGIHRTTVTWWAHEDHMGFNARFQAAKAHFVERLEDIAFQRILRPDGKNRTGGDVLVITMLNAHAPEKYKQNVVVVDETPKRVAAKLAELAKQDAEERKTAEKLEELHRSENITAIERMREKGTG